MKRLLIIVFLLISSATIMAVNEKKTAKEGKQDICCTKKQDQPGKSLKPDYIFWEPVSRLMVIPN